MSHTTALVSPSIEYYLSVLLLSNNRLLQSLKNGFCQKVKKGGTMSKVQGKKIR